MTRNPHDEPAGSWAGSWQPRGACPLPRRAKTPPPETHQSNFCSTLAGLVPKAGLGMGGDPRTLSQRLLPAGPASLLGMPGWLRRREEGAAGPRGGPPREGGCVPVLTPAALPSCRYWDDFHACTLTALTDCQEGATDLWEKLRRESKNLDFQGSLFELCGGGSGAAPSLLPPALPLLLAALWAALVTWLPF